MNKDPVKSTGHYIHRISYNRRERMVGLFVFSSLVLFAALIVITGQSQHWFEKRVTFYIEVDSSEGISHGSVVKVLGSEVGEVTDLSLAQDRKIRVAIEVYEGRRSLIRTDARAIVNRMVSITNALIEIESESIDAPMLPNGATIPVEETPSLSDLLLGIANIIQSAENKELLAKFEAIMPKLEQTVENAHKIIAQIATGHGTLGAAVFDRQVEQDLKTVVVSGAQILTEAEGIIGIARQRLVDIEPVLKDAAHVASDMHEVTQTLPEMVNELKKTVALANSALTLINEELRVLPGITLDAKRTLYRADRVLEGVENTWPLSTSIQDPVYHPLVPTHPVHD